MNRTTKTLIGAVAIATLWGGTALAQDGTANLITGNVDIHPNTIQRFELSPLLRQEFDGLRTDTDANTTWNANQQVDINTNRNRSIINWNWNWVQQGQMNQNTVDIDAFQATRPDGTDSSASDALAVGENSTAAGFGATVGIFVPEACGAGSLVSGACYDADQFEADGVTLLPTAVNNGSYVAEHVDPVNNGTALGANTLVSHDHSTAVGADAVSTNDHQVTLGTSEDTVKAEGITSQLSKDRQTGPLEIVTSDGQGNLATDGGATHAAIDANSLAIGDNSAAIDANGLRIDENSAGVAMALAMDVPDVDIDKTFGLAASWGNFEGENAFAAAAAWRIDPTWSVNAGIGVGVNTHTVGGRAGIRGQW